MEHYPCGAQELPNDIQHRAYGSGGLPVEVDIPELGIILGDNKMRGRKKEHMPDWLQHVPEAYRGLVLQQMGANKRGRSSSSNEIFVDQPQQLPLPCAPLLRQAHKPAQPPTQLASGHGELRDASMLPLHNIGVGEPAINQPQPAPNQPGPASNQAEPAPNQQDTAGGAAGIGPPSVEDLEDALLKGMMSRHTQRKPAAVDTKKTDVVMKKPSAATTLKRHARCMVPDASNIDMSGIFARLRARKGSLDRKRFMSMAYHSAKATAKRSGFSDDDAKAIARDVCAQASAVFHEQTS